MIRRPPAELLRLRRRLRVRRGAPVPGARPVRDTSIERAVAGWLSEGGREFHAQHRLTPGFAVDFYVPSARLAVECHGTYYHADPARYAGRRLTAEQRRKQRHDAAVARLVRAAGWRLLVLWEEDIAARPEWCRRRLAAALDGEETMSALIASYSRGRTTMCVRHGDLTAEEVDVIVNAANSRLSHGGGVAAAIARRGGAGVQEESDRWVAVIGPVPTGGVAITGAGDLPCRAVIHAVGPVWRGGGEGEPELLRQAVRAALSAAGDRGYASLAMPAISSGVFGFPKALCAEVLVDESLAYLMEHPDGPLGEVRFVNCDEPTVEVFRAEFERRFAGGPED